MVEWLAGNRIRGTSTERTTTTGFNPVSAVAGGWKEVGRTTLGSAGDSISVASLPDKRYYMLITDRLASGSMQGSLTLNNDTGSNYSYRKCNDGGSEVLGVSKQFMADYNGWNTSEFNVTYISNLSTKEKLCQGHGVTDRGAGAGTANSRYEFTGKWANTANAVNRIDWTNIESGSFNTGSECVVLGWDPADTHTTNFWEELASDTASGSVASLESGTFTAKKYLWIQCYVTTSASTFCETLFNNDTGSNYANRASQNGGTDFTRTSQSDLNMFESYGNTTGAYINAFMINNASNEKLGISHSVREGTSGAGNAPVRDENVFKWANTSDQITDISFTPQSGTINSGSFLKVWGSD